MQVAPKISYWQIPLDKTSPGGNTVIRVGVQPLWPTTLKIRNPYVILIKFEKKFTDLIKF